MKYTDSQMARAFLFLCAAIERADVLGIVLDATRSVQEGAEDMAIAMGWELESSPFVVIRDTLQSGIDAKNRTDNT